MKRKKTFETSYKVNKNTMMITPVNSMEYRSKVLENNKEILVRETGIELIQSACMDGGSPLEGRQHSITHITGISIKIPVLINSHLGICACPTHSPKDIDKCSWVFPEHVSMVKAHKNNAKQSVLTFKGGYTVVVDVPYQLLAKQIYRTAYCYLRLSSWQDNYSNDDLIS